MTPPVIRTRLVGAWRVLRGEYVAQPRVQLPSVWISPTQTSGTFSNVTYTLGTPKGNR